MTTQTPDTLADLLRSIGEQVTSFAEKIETEPTSVPPLADEPDDEMDPDLESLVEGETGEGEESVAGKPLPKWAAKQFGVLLAFIRAGGYLTEKQFREACNEAGYKGKGTGGFHNTEDPLVRKTSGGYKITRKGRGRFGWIASQGYQGLF